MKKYILTSIAVAAIVAVAAVNVKIIMSDTSVDVFASIETLAANPNEDNSGSSSNGPRGPSTKYTITCNTSSTFTSTINNNNSSNWNAGGSATVGWGFGNVTANGGYGSGSSNGSTGTATTTVSSTSQRTGYDCPSQNQTSCTPYHPC